MKFEAKQRIRCNIFLGFLLLFGCKLRHYLSPIPSIYFLLFLFLISYFSAVCMRKFVRILNVELCDFCTLNVLTSPRNSPYTLFLLPLPQPQDNCDASNNMAYFAWFHILDKL